MIRPWNLGIKLFLPSRHLWIRPTRTIKDLLSSSKTSTSSSSTSRLYIEIGITDRGWQALGDITSVSSQYHHHQVRNVIVQQGDCLLTMWTCHLNGR